MKTEIQTEIHWSPTPPPGVFRQTHKFSILDVIEDLSALLRTDPSEETEYLIVDWPVKAIIVSLPQYIKQVGPNGLCEKTLGRGIYLGDIAERKIYLDINPEFTGFELHNSKHWVHCEVCDAREGKKVVESSATATWRALQGAKDATGEETAATTGCAL